MFKNIRIVLVETSHSGNIGSAARAMKTMGLNELYLVSPKCIDEQSIALAAGADDIVINAHVVDNLELAIADSTLVVGTSARLRHLQNTLLDPRQCAEKSLEHQGKVAIVFGRERIGLTNDELLRCHYHLNIPANPDYSSLNLAMAVQLVCYELRMRGLELQSIRPISTIEHAHPTVQEMEYFFSRTEDLYKRIGFVQNQAVIRKIRRLYQRVNIEKNELNILLGMLKAVENKLKD
ncbi:RNA methyltransferase, TrmH family, group 1 [Haemophilus pittmaniae HK 85]|uniref:tRNA (cytidine/uridine-2'-O-)-methyltransferase TrmJ n=1 Tax=Haemophilus pittmaniae HK 85 TaxID=1035188 RepID=F9QA37_9PAST|nr:tRNA (cytosine(32)/uridine(32)-2'-O)-methyltransferase TrmJ [Haemophilus pittmaniae]EGV05631.1 RNA methyltransferase, TrmH family, group 1 [Haemophilus pittmaniae HK 85]SNV77059.1 methyltransferase [Haemophilus pittmaniae]